MKLSRAFVQFMAVATHAIYVTIYQSRNRLYTRLYSASTLYNEQYLRTSGFRGVSFQITI